MNRILFSLSELEPDGTLRFADERHRHIQKVLRSKPGDVLKAGQLGGDCCSATVQEISKDGTLLSCTEWYPSGSLHPLDVALAVPRPIMLNRLWSLLSSMGVRRIDLIVSGHTDPAYLRSHVMHPDVIERQMIDGLQQAASLTSLPSWSISESVTDYLAMIDKRAESTARILFENSEHSGPVPALKSGAVLAVGPERGWQAKELREFSASGFGLASLGDEIYRTELACLAAVAVAKDRLQM